MTSRKVLAERLTQRIESRDVNCAVIGLGFIGTTVLHALLSAGFRVYGYDRDEKQANVCRARTEDLCSRQDHKWRVGTQVEPVVEADVAIVAVRVQLRDEHCDLEPVRSAAEILSEMPSQGRLVLIESTVPAGTTRQFASDWMGVDKTAPLFVAHCPERLSVGEDWRDLRQQPRLVGGMDELSGRLAERFLGSFTKRVVPVSAPEVSEVSKLLENAFMSVGIALVAEIGKLTASLGITATEVCRAAATMPGGYRAFYPGPGVGGHCLPNDLELLRITQRSQQLATPLLDGASRSIAGMPEQVVERLETLLTSAGQALLHSRVLLVGIGFKPGSADLSNTAACPIVRLLRSKGAIPFYLDSRVPHFYVDGRPLERVEIGALQPARFTSAIILAGERDLNGQQLQRTAEIILDAGGAHILQGKTLDCAVL